MSEPASLIVQCQISPDALHQWLHTPAPPASDWHDWHMLNAEVSPETLARYATPMSITTSDYLKEIHNNAERPADWYFGYDTPTQTLKIGQTLFSDNWIYTIRTLAVLRGIAPFLQNSATNIILVYDWIYKTNGILAAITMADGLSSILPSNSPTPKNLEAIASDILQPVMDAVRNNLRAPARNDLLEQKNRVPQP